ncbi:DUF2919 domain-containing protein [Vibrio ponticus]|uniref:DUF2919 domain-containing protein n=1 Tax=Vibrio ponticus TaxID=265668 RepID=A0A3N3DWJ1_9VIBR|nr:DUF2919 domain-containing protein [Vibrio ponticus]ROV58796.1 DUF2919 domain-containing protein [Vibrio ponticus]ROV61645.1 DUF2919 domain-containing protein [Vibrio ponticus]
MQYSLEQYDKNGFLHAPKWLWLGWMLLAKAWVVFVVAGVSRDSGNTILSYVYPDHQMLYLGLAMGLPSIALMWLISLRSPERRWASAFVAWGKPITLITAISQLMQSAYHVYLQAGEFSWANGVIMLVLLWFIIYVSQSKTVRDCFKLNETK